MKYSFNCYGHENITSRHKTTLEFTKDEDLSLKGDCIIGIKADFELDKIKEFVKKLNNKKITITIETINNNSKNNTTVEKINAEINPNFSSDKDIVVRKSDFVDGRTFAVNADKAAFELNKDLIDFLREKRNKIEVIVENKL